MSEFNLLDTMNKNSRAAVNKKENMIDIEYINIEYLKPNEKNFYDTSDYQALKASIEEYGLFDNLIVKKIKYNDYVVIGGHRRLKALNELIAEGKIDIKKIPCKVVNFDEFEERVGLIIANATIRELTPVEKAEQVKQLTEIAKEMRSIDKNSIKGKTVDFIADKLKMSSSEVDRYNTIEKKLSPELKEVFKEGTISTNTAYNIAILDEDKQEVAKEVISKAKEEGQKITKDSVLKAVEEVVKVEEVVEDIDVECVVKVVSFTEPIDNNTVVNGKSVAEFQEVPNLGTSENESIIPNNIKQAIRNAVKYSQLAKKYDDEVRDYFEQFGIHGDNGIWNVAEEMDNLDVYIDSTIAGNAENCIIHYEKVLKELKNKS